MVLFGKLNLNKHRTAGFFFLILVVFLLLQSYVLPGELLCCMLLSSVFYTQIDTFFHNTLRAGLRDAPLTLMNILLHYGKHIVLSPARLNAIEQQVLTFFYHSVQVNSFKFVSRD